MRRAAAVLLLAPVLGLVELAACKHSSIPGPATIEAGVVAIDNGCTFLEGVTANQTVISICATVEEIAWAVATFGPLFAASAGPDACPAICASPADKGRIIQAIIARRRARFLLDASAQ